MSSVYNVKFDKVISTKAPGVIKENGLCHNVRFCQNFKMMSKAVDFYKEL